MNAGTDYNHWLPELMACPLFEDTTGEDILLFLKTTSPTISFYSKEQMIFSAGQEITAFGVFLNTIPKMNIQICRDRWQSPRYYCPGWLFAELPAFSEDNKIPFDVYARNDCYILFITPAQLFARDVEARIVLRIQQNLIRLLARKAKLLKRCRIFYEQIDITDGLYRFLKRECQIQKSRIISMPVETDELAEILLIEEADVTEALQELEDKGLLARNPDGTLILEDMKQEE